MKTLRLIMLAVMACVVLTCCTEELTNENGNGGNNGNGGTTTPTQYMWPKYKGLADFDGHYTDNVVLKVGIEQYSVWFNVYMKGRLGDTLIHVSPDPNGIPLDKVVPFNFSAGVKYNILYIGDTTRPCNTWPLCSLLFIGDSAVIKSNPSDGGAVLFRGVKCD